MSSSMILGVRSVPLRHRVTMQRLGALFTIVKTFRAVRLAVEKTTLVLLVPTVLAVVLVTESLAYAPTQPWTI